MPEVGNTYITTLKRAHLEWGSYRHTSSRGIVYGEGYLQIPANVSRRFGIYNSNHSGTACYYNCNSVEGYLRNVTFIAAGSSRAGDIHAKQFHGSGNLQLIGDWFNHVHAVIGDRVRITWTSPTDIEIEKL